MTALVTNNAVGTLASSINDSVLSLTLNSGQGALFPNPGAGQFFYATIIDASNNKEIVKVTARATSTFTIVRAQDGTSARAFASSDRVELRPVAALHNNYPQLDTANTFVGNQAVTGKVTATDDIQTSQQFITTGAAATRRVSEYQTAGVKRWELGAEATAEGSGNAGSNFTLRSYDDAGTMIADVMSVVRSTGIMSVLAGFLVGANKADAFPAGTKLLFNQAAVPAGWTGSDALADHALRVVTQAGGLGGSTGGSVDFTTAFTTRTINQANLPNVNFNGSTSAVGDHGHPTRVSTQNNASTDTGGGMGLVYLGSNNYGPNTGSPSDAAGLQIGGAGAHSHTASVNSGGSGTPLDFTVKYTAVIVGTKA